MGAVDEVGTAMDAEIYLVGVDLSLFGVNTYRG